MLYSRTPDERPPSPTTIPLIRPHFVWRTVFPVCMIPDQRPSLWRDQRPGQMGFSPSRATTSFPRNACGASTYVPNCVLLHCCAQTLWSNSITLNCRLLFWRYNDILDGCCVVMLPARRGPDAFAVIQVLHPGICYYQRQCNMMFYGKCYVNTLSNSDKSQQLVHEQSSIVDYFAQTWCVNIMGWTDL